jgi:hypothetical protein
MSRAFTQVKAYIIDNGINLADILALNMILETVFGNPDCVTMAERKLEALK